MLWVVPMDEKYSLHEQDMKENKLLANKGKKKFFLSLGLPTLTK